MQINMADDDEFTHNFEDASLLEGEDSDIPAMETTGDEQELDSDDSLQASPVSCSCRSQCSRKLKTAASGKVTGCPCKAADVHCCENCKCGASKNKPCKNKDPSQETAGPLLIERPDAPEHERVEHEVISVDEIIDALDHETLVKVAKRGFMSRVLQLKDLIQNIESNPDPEEPQPSIPAPIVPPLCKCGSCREMPTEKERVCCKERRLCRSNTQVFRNICLDSENLETVIRSLADTYVFTPTFDNRAMRHSAYRQYVMWIHGHLGKGHRKVIPSCCVWQIRKHYPSPNGHYTGIKSR